MVAGATVAVNWGSVASGSVGAGSPDWAAGASAAGPAGAADVAVVGSTRARVLTGEATRATAVDADDAPSEPAGPPDAEVHDAMSPTAASTIETAARVVWRGCMRGPAIGAKRSSLAG